MDPASGIEAEYHHKNNRVSYKICVVVSDPLSLHHVTSMQDGKQVHFLSTTLMTLETGVLLERASVCSKTRSGKFLSGMF